MLHMCLYRRETGFCSCVVERNWKRVSFTRKSANVACRIVERKGREEAGLSSKKNTGNILYLLQQISVSR
jgi:hypothetical protein